MNTLMMRKEDLEEEGIQGIALEILKLRLRNLMTSLTRRTILIAFKSLKGSWKLKEYNDENSFKLVILKPKRYALLWYEHLKKSMAREVKSKIKIWSKLKKHMDKRFLPPSYKQQLHLKIASLNQENLMV